jgi:hypothetical protein
MPVVEYQPPLWPTGYDQLTVLVPFIYEIEVNFKINLLFFALGHIKRHWWREIKDRNYSTTWARHIDYNTMAYLCAFVPMYA